MKKKILSIALVAMSLVAFNGMAQTSKNDNSVKTENVKCNRADKKGQRPEKNPYEGLTLSDAQKAKLQQLDSKRQEERQQKMQAREDKQQQDRAAGMEARKASKKEYLNEVKAIIGPDQYVVFLENMYINGGGQRDGKPAMQGQRAGKQGFAHNKAGKNDNMKKGKRNADKGQRGNRQQAAAAQS